jgi:hypothetical protein
MYISLLVVLVLSCKFHILRLTFAQRRLEEMPKEVQIIMGSNELDVIDTRFASSLKEEAQ